MIHVIAVMPVTRLIVDAIKRGNFYLVDVGKLIGVADVSPGAAAQVANRRKFGMRVERYVAHPKVYQLGSEGELIAVYE